MARKRMIDPSLWQDEGMAELTPRQQLLYIGMFSNADDDGRLKGSASAIRLTLPTVYAGCTLADIDADIDAVLVQFRQLRRYESAGRIYIVFRNYRKWQRIDKPSPSILPEPPTEREDSPNVPRMVVEQSENIPAQLKVVKEKVEEEKIEEASVRRPPAELPLAQPPTPAPKATTRAKGATPAPDSFPISDDMRAWADEHAPGVDVDRETDRFLDRNRASGTTYKDWHAAWRNWLTSPYAKPQQLHPNGRAPTGAPLSNEQAKQQRTIAALRGVGGNHAPVNVPDEPLEARFSVLRRDHP